MDTQHHNHQSLNIIGSVSSPTFFDEEIFGKESDDPDANQGRLSLVYEQTADLGGILNSLLVEDLKDPSIVGKRK
jgi:hypothetical protein